MVSSPLRAVIDTARSASPRPVIDGWREPPKNFSLFPTAMLSSRFRVASLRWFFRTRRGCMIYCSAVSRKRCSRLRATNAGWAQTSGSWLCFTPGIKKCYIIRICIVSFQPEAFLPITPAGFVPANDSFSPARCSGKCSAATTTRRPARRRARVASLDPPCLNRVYTCRRGLRRGRETHRRVS